MLFAALFSQLSKDDQKILSRGSTSDFLQLVSANDHVNTHNVSDSVVREFFFVILPWKTAVERMQSVIWGPDDWFLRIPVASDDIASLGFPFQYLRY